MDKTLSIDDYIRQRVDEELASRPRVDLQPVEQFCEEKGISRITVWRAEKRGELKLTRIGKRVFVNMQQFNFQLPKVNLR